MLHVETTPSVALDSARIQNNQFLDQLILPDAAMTTTSFGADQQSQSPSLNHSFHESKADLNISRAQLLNTDPGVVGSSR